MIKTPVAGDQKLFVLDYFLIAYYIGIVLGGRDVAVGRINGLCLPPVSVEKQPLLDW